MSYGDWRPYEPVAKRRARAAREISKLRKRGKEIQPIDIQGRKIARTFWGEAWCKHLEKFSDYENRLPRGRTYVRNGSVCHLAISKGNVEAIVSGSELYRISINITHSLQANGNPSGSSAQVRLAQCWDYYRGVSPITSWKS